MVTYDFETLSDDKNESFDHDVLRKQWRKERHQNCDQRRERGLNLRCTSEKSLEFALAAFDRFASLAGAN